MHILGKGTQADTEIIRQRIQQVSTETGCSIVFDGYKTGKEYDTFIQSCHIGLSTQQPNGKYNVSSFPSKILMYMSNGLPVVSVKIPAVYTSNVGAYIYYYDEPTPANIADAVRSVPTHDYILAREKLRELDEKFKKELSDLLT
jgi:glycosyltransferase involved in cell wall biosynthesis